MAYPDQGAYDRASDDIPDWGVSDRGRIEGFYNREDYWVEWKDGAWQYTDGTSAEGPHADELNHSDLMTVSWTNTKGDLVYATIAGGIDGDYDLDEGLRDLDDRESGKPQ